jgi:sugar phosphate isomerase/epimerase
MSGIGIATSVARAGGYDAFAALELARAHGFDLLQVYVDRPERYTRQRWRELAREARRAAVRLIVHAPEPFGRPALLQPGFLEVCELLLGEEPRPLVVAHMDAKAPCAAALSAMAALRERGFLPAPENAHRAASQEEALAEWDYYLALIREADDCVVTLDLPRLFAAENHFGDRWLPALRQWRAVVQAARRPVLLHLIDCRSADQRNRDNWRHLGAGDLPWQLALPLLEGLPHVAGVVLEFEEPRMAVRSLPFARRMLRRLRGAEGRGPASGVSGCSAQSSDPVSPG